MTWMKDPCVWVPQLPPNFSLAPLLRPGTTLPIHQDGVKHANSLKQRENII